MKQPNPPYWADRFLRWYCNPRFLEEIEGDIYELFDRRAEKKGHKTARIKFIWDVLRFFRWSNIKKSNSNYSTMNSGLLFKNYLKLGLRNIRKNFVSSSINIFGLAIAIGFAITTFIFADMQLNMDTFHTNRDRIYQLTNFVDQDGDDKRWSDSPILLGPQLLADHPGVEAVSRVEYRSASVRFNADVFDELATFVDPSYMEIFDFPLLNGNKQVLYDKSQIVISREMAIKYFDDEDPMGKDLSFKFLNGKIMRFTVGAVMDEFPFNNSMRDEFYISIENFFDLQFQDKYTWSFLTDGTFILMKEGENIESIASSYPEYIELQHGSNPEWNIRSFEPIPLPELSQRGYEIVGSVSGGGHPAGRIALAVIACFLLGMACFNFMNISVVSATKRLKEIALRKVMGGQRRQIINQFLVENTLQCLFALMFGILLAYFLFIPGFDALVPQMDLQLRASSAMAMFLFFVSLLIGVGLISGAYPAFYISKFEPVTIFKGTQKLGSKNLFSKIMLGIQFFLAIITIVACLVMVDQSFYLASKDWGYDPSGSLSVYVNSEEQYEKLRNEIIASPDVQTFTASSNLIGRGVALRAMEYDGRQIRVRNYGVREGYFETFRLRLKEGRFLTDQAADQESAVVVNEKFVKEMGWTDDPINKTFVYDSLRRTIVGVVEDYHYYDFYSGIDAVIIEGLKTSNVRYLSMRTSSDKVFELDMFTKEAWQKIAPNDPYDRVFQEDVFDDFYIENTANIKILIVVSIIAIVLACLGLYGLLSFNIQGKLKEFSVRKVLGAAPRTLAQIAGKQYMWIILISFVAGAPLGFLGMDQLMNSIFIDVKGVSILPFAIAIVLLSITMIITVAGQVRKAIEINPAEVLRSE
ncbi:MAG: ABC transporter permease [Cyclobacteriaceae bacterium]